jgi:hypothetical protein
MRHLKIYENFNSSTLIIVDVQHSFKKFFTDNYITALNKYCQSFKDVYQIWDNHINGKNPDKDYLYDKNPDIPIVLHIFSIDSRSNLLQYVVMMRCS